jgi:hypothetical protein
VPDITTPAALTYSGGALRTFRVVPARLTYTAATVTTARDTSLTTAAVIPQLDRLRRMDRIVRDDGVDPRFQYIWQQTMEAIEGAFETVNARVDEVAILARISAVEALSQAANDNAVAAQATVATVSAAVATTFTQIDPIYQTRYLDELEP